MSSNDKSSEPSGRSKDRLQVCIDARRLEIELFWRRALFFWVFIASAFIAFFTSFKSSPAFSIVIACFGLVCSLAWTLANRGSKYWQETWELRVEEVEDDVVGPLFKLDGLVQKGKGKWLSARRYSVSKLAIAVSDYVFLLWVSILAWLMLNPVVSDESQLVPDQVHIYAFVGATLIYLALVAWKGRSSKRTEN